MKKDDIIEIGRTVLTIEGQAVQSLAARLDDSFEAAVNLLASCESRVIVTGLGKSGLVGRKIAATLASCGTPALFIHAADAGHGDLGMISEKDVLIAISYSGETKELLEIVDFAERIGIKMIALTGNARSRLARYSHIVLEAKVEKEAEPTGLIPTASSTVAMAVGDALAVALMRKKGFGEKEFAFYHPRGVLGKKLLKVSSLMHSGRHMPSIQEDADISFVLQEMTEKKLGMTCVVNQKKELLGVITDGDLRRMLQKHGDRLFTKKARECMTPNPLTIKSDDLATKALKKMEDNRVTSLIVQNEKGGIEGIIHLHDLWRTEMF
ncbi:MAG: KpsF/GutQ family sugar-phosphate isomerase [Acidobacteria bacterium]|nr:KpsF/GutQ family sugar-phosphate isomerase [Acidobacteriota bacterium]MBU1474446.1 KpsF/GutQ family sugar-phosphate isomerase [Acidobacteriota bacterium]MBU4253046.1 KpsF/GutQ family sugar-phosphate isomerase [Acidobacteriota bacterium]MBU4328892.1 KpsF/GutQ family sugar-phosphate isomerase [Acidobacteriota bacterium]